MGIHTTLPQISRKVSRVAAGTRASAFFTDFHLISLGPLTVAM
jgi:hypothetical protein